MKSETKETIDFIQISLCDIHDTVTQALIHRSMPAPQQGKGGPFYGKLLDMGLIADEESPITEETGKDLLYLFSFLPYFRGSYATIFFEFLSRVHSRMPLMNHSELVPLLNNNPSEIAFWINEESLHPVDQQGKTRSRFSGYDPSYRYARYEVEALSERIKRLHINFEKYAQSKQS